MESAAAESSNSKLSLKLFIDMKTQKVLFAEADKTAVDSLVHKLPLPMGKEGSLGNLHKSIENLNTAPPTAEEEGGFLKGEVTYMVTDDMTVKPVSTIDLRKELDGKDAETLEEKVVDIGKDEEVKLLSTIPVSKTVLTDVFLTNIGSNSKGKIETKLSVKINPMKKGKGAKPLYKPRRPSSPFFLFIEEFKRTYMEKHPNNQCLASIGTAGGNKWKSMSDAERARYEAMAYEMRVVYQNELEAYNRRLVAGDGDGDGDGPSPDNEDSDNSWIDDDDDV